MAALATYFSLGSLNSAKRN